MIREKVLATGLPSKNVYLVEDSSILFVSKDNQTIALNFCSNKAERSDQYIPNSIILTEKPIGNFKVLSRVISSVPYPDNLFDSDNRVIANSMKDKLKSFLILKELRNCM